MALKLRRRGIRRVRPLEGGLEAWLALGYPVAAKGGGRMDGFEEDGSADGLNRAP